MTRFVYAMLVGAILVNGASGWAQSATERAKENGTVTRTFYLHNVNDIEAGNEVVIALRNVIDPADKIFYVRSQQAIIMRASPEELTRAEAVLKDLDYLKKTYRLTYTIKDTDGGKLTGIQHFAVIVVAGAKTSFKNGSKIPVLTSEGNTGGGKTEFTYIDVGLSIDASLVDSPSGVRLESKIDRSSVAEEKAQVNAEEPVIRETMLQGTSILTPGKEIFLGSLDVPGSTRHLEIGVVAEIVP